MKALVKNVIYFFGRGIDPRNIDGIGVQNITPHLVPRSVANLRHHGFDLSLVGRQNIVKTNRVETIPEIRKMREQRDSLLLRFRSVFSVGALRYQPTDSFGQVGVTAAFSVFQMIRFSKADDSAQWTEYEIQLLVFV